MKIRHLFAILCVTFCLTSFASAHAISRAAVSQIRAGVTTEADLVRLFGPPDTKLTTNHGVSSFDWFRSACLKPGGYVPVFGPFLGGLDFELQQLTVVVGPSGRVSRVNLYDSNGAVRDERTHTETKRVVDYRK